MNKLTKHQYLDSKITKHYIVTLGTKKRMQRFINDLYNLINR